MNIQDILYGVAGLVLLIYTIRAYLRVERELKEINEDDDND